MKYRSVFTADVCEGKGKSSGWRWPLYSLRVRGKV